MNDLAFFQQDGGVIVQANQSLAALRPNWIRLTHTGPNWTAKRCRHHRVRPLSEVGDGHQANQSDPAQWLDLFKILLGAFRIFEPVIKRAHVQPDSVKDSQ